MPLKPPSGRRRSHEEAAMRVRSPTFPPHPRYRAPSYILLLAILSALILALGILLTSPAGAHDIWINKERRTNAQGEWCCNTHDCFPVEAKEAAGGFLILPGEFVPRHEAQVSGDGRYWVCRRPDKTRRCFFFPPPSM